MPSYLIESYFPRARTAEIEDLTRRAREAAEGLAREGKHVRYLRSSFLPDDEMCLLWFEAPTPALAGEAGRRARLDFDRIVEAVDADFKDLTITDAGVGRDSPPAAS